MTGVIIRPLTAEDKAEWRRLWTGYLEFYESTVPEEVYETTFSRLLAGNAGTEHEYRGLIAEIDGNPVGLVHFLFHRHCWKIENVCYLQDLYADPQVRGQGIGRELLRQGLVAAATRWPAGTTVIAKVLTDNPRSLRLFEGAGFLSRGTRVDHGASHHHLERSL